MKRTFTFFLVILFYSNLFGQNQAKGFHLHKPVDMAAILAKKPSLMMGFSSVSEARSIINDIVDAVDVQQNFTVMSTTQVDNAAAVMYRGQRYILYNPSFINQLDNAANTKWASISVLGHEIGHHVLGHTMDGNGSQIPKELAADEFSGVVMHRLGATLQQAQLAMRLIGSPAASATHPAENDRLTAIARGWNSTGVQESRPGGNVAVTPPTDNSSSYPAPRSPSSNDRSNYPASGSQRNYPGDVTKSYPSESAGRGSYPSRGTNYPGNSGRAQTPGADIAYDVVFNIRTPLQYFITPQNQVITFRGSRPVVVAKIAATSRQYYPYVIYDDQQQIYIDKRGRLVADNGRNVGYIVRHNQ